MASTAIVVVLKVLRDRSARDKLYKVVQYSLKVLLETAKKNGIDSWLFPYFTRIVKRLGQARSLFRFLLVLGVTETFPRVFTQVSSNPLSITSAEGVLNFLSQTGCDLFDSVACAHDVLGTGGRLRAAWWSCFFWLIGIVLAIMRQSTTLVKIFLAEMSTQSSAKIESKEETDAQKAQSASVKKPNPTAQKTEAIITLTKALGDLGHALGILNERIGKYKLITGWCGLVGGSIGLLQSVQKLK